MSEAVLHHDEVDPVVLRGDPNLFRRGVVPLGQELLTGRPLLMSADEACRHLLVVGTTGSGKTELLTGMAAGVILAGGGVIFVDGKGDLSNWGRMAGLAAQAGRADEAFLINMGGGPSSSWNPFTGLTADEAARLLVSSQPPASGDNVMWQHRANALIRVTCRLAWWLAKCDGRLARPSDVERCMMPEIMFAAPTKYPDMPLEVSESVNAYLKTLPGYDIKKVSAQSNTTTEQHGYLSMQWTATFDYLCREAGHVLDVALSDVTAEDAVRRRRIVHISLPVLTMGPSDVEMVGGLVFSAIRRAVANLTPSVTTGEWGDVVPTGGASDHLPPMLVILDEVGHYLTRGMGLMAAQARSTGVGLVFSVQDIASLTESNRREASVIMANCGTRILMRQAGRPDFNTEPMLPSRKRTVAGERRRDLESARRLTLQDKVSRAERVPAYLRDEDGPPAPDSARREAAELHDLIVEGSEHNLALMRADLDWDSNDLVVSLGAGEFIAMRGNSHVVGRAHHATPAIPPVRVTLPKGEAVPQPKRRVVIIGPSAPAEASAEVSENDAERGGVVPDMLTDVFGPLVPPEAKVAPSSFPPADHAAFVRSLTG